MTRLAMDGVDLFIVEHGCAANIKVLHCSCLLYEVFNNLTPRQFIHSPFSSFFFHPPQTAIIRVANCNLHNQAVGEGISAVVQDVNIRQYIEQQQHSEATRLQPAGQGQGLSQPPLLRRSVWLEAGSVNLNLITADIALAADHPAKCEVQRQFLELHDAQTKR